MNEEKPIEAESAQPSKRCGRGPDTISARELFGTSEPLAVNAKAAELLSTASRSS